MCPQCPQSGQQGQLAATDDEISDFISSLTVGMVSNDNQELTIVDQATGQQAIIPPSDSNTQKINPEDISIGRRPDEGFLLPPKPSNLTNQRADASQGEALRLSQPSTPSSKITRPQSRHTPEEDEAVSPKALSTSADMQTSSEQPTSAGQYQHSSQDLSDWLDMTGFHDAKYRARGLARYREMIRMEGRKAELLQEGENDRLEMASLFPTLAAGFVDPPLSSTASRGAIRSSFGGNAQSLPARTDASGVSPKAHASLSIRTIKRSHEDEDGDDEDSPARKLLRTDYAGSIELQRRNGGWKSKEQLNKRSSALPSRPLPIRQPSYDPYTSSHYYYEQGRPDSSWDQPPYSTRSNREFSSAYSLASPIYASYRDDSEKLDLGWRGDSRYFTIKSNNPLNIEACMSDGVWVTQMKNSATLTSAFAECKNVILIFSITGSHAFQGYARMTTAPSPNTPAPKWRQYIQMDTSDPFRVEWYCTTEMKFSAVKHIHNKLNNNKSICFSRDGQEIEYGGARKLIKAMDECQSIDRDSYSQSPDPMWDSKPRTPEFAS